MQQIQKQSLADMVAGNLQKQIQESFYAVDSKLPTEPELMKTFGVGRSTIREAIKLLVNSGFLNVQQGVGTFVKSKNGHEHIENTLEKSKLSDIHEVRELLEIKIAEKAAQKRTLKHLKKIEEALAARLAYAENGDIDNCIKADIQFHTAIAESCGNSLLCDLYNVTSEHISKSFSNQYKNTDAFIETHSNHEALYRHIKNKDSKKALKAIEQIIGTF
ncbi:FadR/GntR family transcriptional regulator [Chitinophagaceae bacterium LY-5]|uniref:FadR/GntR family transcriptional regulator n=2 Tax=Polluticaenibacter yanchengensis TaxID=3014562 RepID=A0ABT4ULE3_9BACT|nr:FadR/GntR family transcriptional regulator [Chitinophagaceae bacterium LY-5]